MKTIRQPWSPESLTKLADLFPTASREELLAAFPYRTFDAIRTQANTMKIYRPKVSRWTPEVDERIRAEYPMAVTSVLASSLGMRVKTLNDRACMLGLQKNPAVLRQQLAERARLPRKKIQHERTGTPSTPGQRKVRKPEPKAVVKPWQHPMHSPIYQAWLASTVAGKQSHSIIDSNGKPATVWRNPTC